MEIVEVELKPKGKVERDRFGRPLIHPPDGGKPVAYARTTTFIDVLSDKTALTDWKLRKVLEGVHKQPLIINEFGLIEDPESQEGKRAINKLASWALDEAHTSFKAEQGTAMHDTTDELDMGKDPFIPPEYEPQFEAYVEATKDLEVLAIETFCAQDEYKVAGTFDRLFRIHGEMAKLLEVDEGTVVIGDTKTGHVDYDRGKIGMQLAGYANMVKYDLETHTRSPIHEELDKSLGVIVAMPSTPKPGEAYCSIIPVDLEAGWEAFKLAAVVREHRLAWNRVKLKRKPVLSVGLSK